MKKIWKRVFATGCEHLETLVVTSVGVRRAVCEKCGNVSFSIAPRLAVTTHVTEEKVESELPRASGL